MKKNIYYIILAISTLNLNAQQLPNFTQAIKLNGVNSDAEEAKPVFSEDGNKMYFVRAYHKENTGYDKVKSNEDIWEAELDNEGNWTKITNEKSINDEKNNSIIGQGKGSNYYLLNTYQNKKELKYGIALVKKEAEHQWSDPVIIPIPKLKYEGNFYDFFITKDEKALLISIKGEDTNGEEDLYVSLNKQGKWSSPINLGTKINTSGYESAPFLSKDNKYLYFSSNGRKDGYGDADIYVSERLNNSWTNWSEPKNLGSVINSEKMDSYFTINNKNEYFFSSNRDGADLNIYQANEEEPEPVFTKEFLVKGIVRDTITGKPMSLEIIITSDKEELKIKSDKDGRYEAKLEKGMNYVFNILEPKFHEHHDDFKTPPLEDGSSSIENNIWMKPYKAGDEIKLEALYFVVNRDSLRNESLPIVEKLALILLENPDIKISIEGHTSSEGLRHLNLDLSERRAEKIKSVLAEKGIKKNRLKTKGYGQSKPKVKNDTEEHRKMNRRVEFIILD